jgi:hypothetical protein
MLKLMPSPSGPSTTGLPSAVLPNCQSCGATSARPSADRTIRASAREMTSALRRRPVGMARAVACSSAARNPISSSSRSWQAASEKIESAIPDERGSRGGVSARSTSSTSAAGAGGATSSATNASPRACGAGGAVRVSPAGLPAHTEPGAVRLPFIRKASVSSTEPSPMVTP